MDYLEYVLNRKTKEAVGVALFSCCVYRYEDSDVFNYQIGKILTNLNSLDDISKKELFFDIDLLINNYKEKSYKNLPFMGNLLNIYNWIDTYNNVQYLFPTTIIDVEINALYDKITLSFYNILLNSLNSPIKILFTGTDLFNELYKLDYLDYSTNDAKELRNLAIKIFKNTAIEFNVNWKENVLFSDTPIDNSLILIEFVSNVIMPAFYVDNNIVLYRNRIVDITNKYYVKNVYKWVDCSSIIKA